MNAHPRDLVGVVKAQGRTLRVEFLTDLAQLPPIAARWEALNKRESDHDAPFFQSYAWNFRVAQLRTQRSPAQFRLLVATVWRDADLVGVWPLSLQRMSGAWIARNLDDPFGQFAGVAFRDAADIEPGVAAIIDALRHRADGMHIESVVAGTPLHAALRTRNTKMVSSQEAVVVDMRAFPSFKDFAQTVNSKTRKNLRNLRNRMDREHETQHLVVEDRERLAPLVSQTFEARLEWLHRNGRTSAAFRTDDFRALVTGLTEAEGLHLLGFSLAKPDGWLSAQWGFVYAGRYYAYISAMNADYDAFSPGRLHLAMVVEACSSRDIGVLELMPPAINYKLEWNGRTKTVDTMSAPFTLKGRLILGAADAMPTVRKLSRLLPGSWRRSLARRLNR